GSCECYALSAVAAVSWWLMLLLSPLLSAAGPVPHLRGFLGAVTAPCHAQAPPLPGTVPPRPFTPDGPRPSAARRAARHAPGSGVRLPAGRAASTPARRSGPRPP